MIFYHILLFLSLYNQFKQLNFFAFCLYMFYSCIGIASDEILINKGEKYYDTESYFQGCCNSTDYTDEC